MTALVLQHGELGPPGLLATWARDRGVELEIHRTEDGARGPDPADYEFLVVLGSRFNPADDDPSVTETMRLVRAAVEAATPVLGLCFGGQALAAALGGEVIHLHAPERGWQLIETDDPEAIPPGPWLEWHRDGFTLPPGATEVARNAVGTQAFRHGRHLGTQFHPESTIEIVCTWADHDGIDRALVEGGRDYAGPAAEAACTLFDGFLAGVRGRGEARV